MESSRTTHYTQQHNGRKEYSKEQQQRVFSQQNQIGKVVRFYTHHVSKFKKNSEFPGKKERNNQKHEPIRSTQRGVKTGTCRIIRLVTRKS